MKRSKYASLPANIICNIYLCFELEYIGTREGYPNILVRKTACICREWALILSTYHPRYLYLEGRVSGIQTLQQLLKTNRGDGVQKVCLAIYGSHKYYLAILGLLGVLPNLTTLILDGDVKVKMTSVLTDLVPTLQHLSVQMDKITISTPEVFKGLKRLELADHGDWHGQSLPEGVQALDCEHIHDLTLPRSLQDLEVINMTVADLNAVVLLPSIRKIHSENGITYPDKQFRSIVLPALDEFTLYNGDEEMRYLTLDVTKVKRFIINYCSVTCGLGSMAAEY